MPIERIVRFLRVTTGLSLLIGVILLVSISNAAEADLDQVVELLKLVLEADPETARNCLNVVSQKIQSGELDQKQIETLKPQLEPTLLEILSQEKKHALFLEAAVLASAWRNKAAVDSLRKMAAEPGEPESNRIVAFHAITAIRDPSYLATAARMLVNEADSDAFRSSVIATLGKLEDTQVAGLLLVCYPGFSPEVQPRVIEVLTQRAAWSKMLLTVVKAGRLPAKAVNENQVRKMLASRDDELIRLVGQTWGSVRMERNPDREQVIASVRANLQRTLGDAHRGKAVFHRVCGQCHRIHGEGQEVGPEITFNGRNSFDQLLSNVLDPSLVIGASYQARIIVTDDGRVLTGLVTEDNDQRVVLKVQGGKTETVPRSAIDEMQVSKLSLMPEGLEKQLPPQELVDLFWFLCLDRPPSDVNAQFIPGTKLHNGGK